MVFSLQPCDWLNELGCLNLRVLGGWWWLEGTEPDTYSSRVMVKASSFIV